MMLLLAWPAAVPCPPAAAIDAATRLVVVGGVDQAGRVLSVGCSGRTVEVKAVYRKLSEEEGCVATAEPSLPAAAFVPPQGGVQCDPTSADDAQIAPRESRRKE